MKKIQKGIIKLSICTAVAVAGFVSEKLGAPTWLFITLYMLAYVASGYDVLIDAAKNIFSGNFLDENFLMAVATIGAVIIGEYTEAVAVMLFFQVGELFEKYAVNKSRSSITELMNIRPDYANLKKGDAWEKVDPETVNPGDIIMVSAGEKIPLDGVVIGGASMLDTSALTGESVPRSVKTGDEVISGCVNQNGVLEIRVAKAFGESTVSRILDLVENATANKSKSEKFITKFARYYTPIVVGTAVALAIIPSIITGNWSEWVYRALDFLVVSCPCALVISVPLSFFGGIGGASRMGVLIKGSNYLEALAKTETVVFDKTGTLTKGVFQVTDIKPCEKVNKNELLKVAAYAERFSNHPIAISLRDAYKKQSGEEIPASDNTDFEEISGHGIKTVVDGSIVCVGNLKLMAKLGLGVSPATEVGTVVYVAKDDKYLGYIVISDIVKDDAALAIASLKEVGVKNTIMLTGDNHAVANDVAKQLGIDEVYSELLPTDKVAKLKVVLDNKTSGSSVAFVGDGINDAPVLAGADIGIAMGGLGSDAAIEAADIVIMTDEPSKISDVIKISRKTLRISNENIVFALTVKVIVLVLCAIGVCGMWAAVFADVGVSVIAILNAMRALKYKK